MTAFQHATYIIRKAVNGFVVFIDFGKDAEPWTFAMSSFYPGADPAYAVTGMAHAIKTETIIVFATIAEAKAAIEDDRYKAETQAGEMESEKAAEAAAMRYWEEGTSAEMMAKGAEQDAEDDRSGAYDFPCGCSDYHYADCPTRG